VLCVFDLVGVLSCLVYGCCGSSVWAFGLFSGFSVVVFVVFVVL